ncbi:MAG: hypothetical protein GFH27_549291n169 [Chloroflexi bacterium AL-W]|nr:hypothetical protein [Chloroflexi bacterium AL-N1]NOK67364.1 hypothetical protein [Chloroflexi bacterium AL-N10]NOK75144.1 hypothetical protein [Chloroflexi bacterium AL-N5]NOK81931.1 hypothetical protein [Chloroflexi bacterium AL-W]NOK89777.1 hypothetical protein [Chloroflexi bacterium AL-N15]
MDLLHELTRKENNRVLRAITDNSSIIPHRVWTVLYPIYRVQVQTYERHADTFEDLELFIERAIGHTALHSVAELQAFFQLTSEQIEQVLNTLQASTHIEYHKDRVVLTELGWESLRDGRRYEERVGKQVLLFDGFTCRPLPKAMYQARRTQPGALDVEKYSDNHQVQVLFSFDPWHDDELKALAQRPDRHAYNIPDEVQSLEQQWVQRAYLPMHITEVFTIEGHPNLYVYLIDNRLYKHNQPFFVDLFRDHPEIMEPLYTQALPDTQTIQRVLGTHHDIQNIVTDSRGTWRVYLSDSWYHQSTSCAVSQLIRLGDYRIVDTMCVQLWSANTTVRNAAAALKVATWLNTSSARSEQAIMNRAREIATHVEVPIPTLSAILKSATQYDQMEAQKVLQEYVDSVDT